MSIINGFVPLPNWFIAGAINSNLTNREYKLYFTIGVEIFRFPETREGLSKELSCRFLQSLTGFHFSHIAKILKKFSKMGLITVKKSFVKGQGSIITLVAPIATIEGENELTAVASVATEKSKKVALTATKGVAPIATNPINLSIKKDLQKDDPDSFLKIEQTIEEKPMENSPNSLPDIQSLYTRSKQSNSNNSTINLPSPAGLASSNTGNSDFTSLGSVLTAPSVVNNPAIISDKAISLGKSILLKKGFSSSEVQLITDRITASMTDKDIKSKDKYFIAACNKETRKVNSPASSVHRSTCAALPVQKITSPVIEEKQDPPAVEVIERIKTMAPAELYQVIMTVDGDEKTQKALRFFSSDIVKKEILASHYVAAFKKEFPEIKIC